MKILCRTLFDCSRTGTTGHFRLAQLPVTDRMGFEINNIQDWNFSRNQQRNFESILQLVSLFTQPLNVSWPCCHGDSWTFEFDIEYQSVFADQHDPLGLLKKHSQGIPMILGLNEQAVVDRVLLPDQNIKFEFIEF